MERASYKEAMKNNGQKSDTNMEIQVNANEISRISAGTVIKGEVFTANDIRIDGTFEGKVQSKGKVVVGEKAVIKGDILCGSVDFWGRIAGDIYAQDTLSLKGGCIVKGNLHVKRLVVELGSRFDGNCHMISDGEFEKLTGGIAPSSVAPAAPAAHAAEAAKPAPEAAQPAPEEAKPAPEAEEVPAETRSTQGSPFSKPRTPGKGGFSFGR